MMVLIDYSFYNYFFSKLNPLKTQKQKKKLSAPMPGTIDMSSYGDSAGNATAEMFVLSIMIFVFVLLFIYSTDFCFFFFFAFFCIHVSKS